MYLLLAVCVWIILGVGYVDWKRWKEYYPTVLYYCLVNLLYEFLYYNHSLWTFRTASSSILNHTIINLAFLSVINPIAIMIYLQRFPQKRMTKVVYVLAWSFLYWIIEFIFSQKGSFVYGNGWSIWHSAWFDPLMFIMFRLHFTKPLLALGVTLVIIAVFLSFFPVPLSSMK